MAQASLEQIVQRMIDAGEPEENIAAVIKEFKASPPVDTPAPITTPQQSFRPGNIDLARQPRVPNPQGGTSTVFSRSFNIDGKEILLPSVTPDGRFLQTDDDVINEYKKSGLHLGEFPSPEEATKYATQLHADYEAGKYNKPEKRGLYEHIFEAPEFVTDAASRFAESVTEPVLDESPWMARVKGFLGGATEGAAGLLSPANIATMGRGRIPQIASQILGAGQTAHGISDLASGDTGGLADIAFGILGVSTPKVTSPELTPKPIPRRPELSEINPKVASAIVEPPKPRSTEDKIYDIARDKFNMGRDNPELIERELNPFAKIVEDSKNKPTATFLGLQEDGTPLWNIKGGPRDKSTVTTKTLQDLGIEVPAVPPDASRVRGDDLRKMFQQQRSAAMDSKNKGFKGTVPDEAVVEATPDNITAAKPAPVNVDLRPVLKDQLKEGVEVVPRKFKPQQEQSLASELWNAPRTLQSIDLPGITSAALRQSRPLAFTRDWFNAWEKAFQAFRNKDDAFKAMNEVMRQHKYMQPRYEPKYSKTGKLLRYTEKPSFAEEVGLDMTDVLNHREEVLTSSLAEKIPGYGRYVKASNRAYVAFLNQLRLNKFEQLMQAVPYGERNLVKAKEIAEFVNNATGRGKIERLEPVADILGNTLYSPKALAARLQFFNPAKYLKTDPRVRNEYIIGLARVIGSWGAFSGLASMAGASVSTDPTNPDFGKIRIGNTRIDPGAGLQQILVVLGKMANRGSTSSTTGKFTPFGEGPFSQSMLSTPGNYLYNQLHPSMRYITDLALALSDKTKFDVTDRTLQMVLPMYAADIAQAAKEDATTAEVFAPLLSSMGTGVQTYDKGTFGEPEITPFIEEVLGTQVPTMQLGK